MIARSLVTVIVLFSNLAPSLAGMTVIENNRVQHLAQSDDSHTSSEPHTAQPSDSIKGSQHTKTDIPYGEIFNKEKEELPFYLNPEFGGLDGSDHRSQVRPNSAGQRLDMDQYNRQVRPRVGP